MNTKNKLFIFIYYCITLFYKYYLLLYYIIYYCITLFFIL